MMNLLRNVRVIEEQIKEAAVAAQRKPEEISYLMVTKGRSVEEMQQAYSLGIRDFGENRVSEALRKMEQLPSDIRWHYIGKLQKNKAAKVVGRFLLIHSIDSVELAEKVARTSVQQGVASAILLEANTSGEKSKSGLKPHEWKISFPYLLTLKGIDILGLMTIAPLNGTEAKVRLCFSTLKKLKEELNEEGGHLSILSMGMSLDFRWAIQEGATLLRIGSAFFSEQQG